MSKRKIFYGPHPCEKCGATIAKESVEFGTGDEFDYPREGPYPNTKWQRHKCEGKQA